MVKKNKDKLRKLQKFVERGDHSNNLPVPYFDAHKAARTSQKRLGNYAPMITQLLKMRANDEAGRFERRAQKARIAYANTENLSLLITSALLHESL